MERHIGLSDRRRSHLLLGQWSVSRRLTIRVADVPTGKPPDYWSSRTGRERVERGSQRTVSSARSSTPVSSRRKRAAEGFLHPADETLGRLTRPTGLDPSRSVLV